MIGILRNNGFVKVPYESFPNWPFYIKATFSVHKLIQINAQMTTLYTI